MRRVITRLGPGLVVATSVGLVDVLLCLVLEPEDLRAAALLSVMLAWIGFGLLLAALVVVLARDAKPHQVARAVAGIITAAVAVVMGWEFAEAGRLAWTVALLGFAVAVWLALATAPRSGIATCALAVVVAVVPCMGAIGRVGPDLLTRSTAAPDVSRPNRPHVILILIDTLRADHLSAYGYPIRTSPRLDALATEGVLFERAYAQASYTRESVPSLLTSLYPSQHGHGIRSSKRLNSKLETLAEVLADAGYTTAAFSANALIDPEFGFGQGFEEFHTVHEMGVARASLVIRLWKRADGLAGSLTRQAANLGYWRIRRHTEGMVGNAARDRILAREFRRWLDRRDPKRPFFAYLHFMAPHMPYDPPPWARAELGAPMYGVFSGEPPKKTGCFQPSEPIPDSERLARLALYDANIRAIDSILTSILGEVEGRGLAPSTLVVVTADHGEEFFEHESWGHGQSLYNELIHVPMIMRFPGILPTGVRFGREVMLVDVMPTILAAANVPAPKGIVGRDLSPDLRNSVDAGESIAYAELPECAAFAVVAHSHKGLEWATTEGEQRRLIFDLERDPGERTPLQEEKVATNLAALIAQHRSKYYARYYHAHLTDSSDSPVTIDAAQRERLRALGYVE